MTPKDIQSKLNAAGFPLGTADGRWGPKTLASMQAWFRSGLDLEAGRPAVQHMSDRGLADLKASEGLRTVAYQDSVNVWTIGYGHAATSGRAPIPRAGMRITAAQASEILAADLAEAYEPAVRKALGAVPQHVFDGAVSFCFNLGAGALGRASWVQSYLAGDMKDAERRFMLWDNPPEIIGRRRREADLIFRGKYAS
jgi:lysozyme